MSATLGKQERLTRTKLIGEVYRNGEVIKIPGMILCYLKTQLPAPGTLQVLCTVSKKNFKRAHDRNRIRRLMRESYRLQRQQFTGKLEPGGGQYALLFIFTGRQLPDYPYVFGKISELLRRFSRNQTDLSKEQV
jgi:ribonuclease P protein component